jgi:transcriptional regulator with XRE-family HTH domain
MGDDTPGRTPAAGRRRRRRRTLAEKLDHLFRTVHPRHRGEFSLEEAAAEIGRRGGATISANYLWLLRKGRRDNPTKKHLEALADLFGISPLYFFDDEAAEQIDAELELLGALRDAGVRHLALRAAALTPQTVQALTEMVERARQIEGVPDTPGVAPRPRRGRPWPAPAAGADPPDDSGPDGGEPAERPGAAAPRERPGTQHGGTTPED